MATISCNDFLDHLNDSMEEVCHPDARAHLRDCLKCRSLVDDLGAIELAALELSRFDPEPPERVWNTLRVQLEEEGLIRADRVPDDPAVLGAFVPEARLAEGRSWIGKAACWIDEVFAPLPRPVLAGAYLAVLVAMAFLAGVPLRSNSSSTRWARNTEASTMPLSAQLNSAEQSTITDFRRSDPAVSEVLHKNLAIVDNYIALCEKSVSEEPQNEAARDYLYGAYQQKADLLAEMSDRGDEGQ